MIEIGYKYIEYKNIVEIKRKYKGEIIEFKSKKISEIEIEDKMPNIIIINSDMKDYNNIIKSVRVIITDDIEIGEIPENIEYIIKISNKKIKIYENNEYGLLELNENKREIIEKMIKREEYNKLNYNKRTLISFMIGIYNDKEIMEILRKMEKEKIDVEDDEKKKLINYYIENNNMNKEIFDYIIENTKKIYKTIIFEIVKMNYIKQYKTNYNEMRKHYIYMINELIKLNDNEMINSLNNRESLIGCIYRLHFRDSEIRKKILEKTKDELIRRRDNNKNIPLVYVIKDYEKRNGEETKEVIKKMLEKVEINNYKTKNGDSLFYLACKFLDDEETIIKIFEKQKTETKRNFNKLMINIVGKRMEKVLLRMIKKYEIDEYFIKKMEKNKLKVVKEYYKINKEKLTEEKMKQLIKKKIIEKKEYFPEKGKNNKIYKKYNIIKLIHNL
jgi:hypothetical protein